MNATVDAGQAASMLSTPVHRGCGTRRPGLYVDMGCGSGPGARPVWDFLFDPPVPVPAGITLPTQGVYPYYREGKNGKVLHIIDRVGLQYYPNLLDFVLELQFGLSRRIPSSFPFADLTKDSRLLLVHDRAIIQNYTQYGHPGWLCPYAHKEHTAEYVHEHPALAPPMCIGLWWEDLHPYTAEVQDPAKGTIAWQGKYLPVCDTGYRHHRRIAMAEPAVQRIVRRKMPAFSYLARTRPVTVGNTYLPGGQNVFNGPEYQQAIFASFPVAHLVKVTGSAQENKKYGEAVQGATVKVYEVEQ